MSIYDKNGNSLNSVYDVNGNALDYAYDLSGNQVYQNADAVVLKVMEYNCGSWYDGSHTTVPSASDSAYYALQTGMIQSIDPDILCVNEYTQEFSRTGRTALSVLQEFFPYIHEQDGDSRTEIIGRCIASKYPISDYTVHTYSTADGARYYDSCTIDVDGVDITVVVTHLPYNAQSSSSRYSQLQELIQYLSTQTRFIACGDFNMINLQDTASTDYTNMVLPLLNADFHVANGGSFGFLVTYSDEPDGTWVGRLDQIVTAENMPIMSAYVDTTKLTDDIADHVDHMPLVATVRLN